jgi:hypothetical protein
MDMIMDENNFRVSLIVNVVVTWLQESSRVQNSCKTN